MKIQEGSINNKETTIALQQRKAPSFKSSAGVLNFAGNVMQGIENQGFWLTFLIQDFLGMTCPRTGAGFLRDKEVTGHFNVQEGFEVLGREGMTGPCMMAVAPLGLAIAALFGRSTSVNSKLIRRFGDNFKEIIAKSDFKKDLFKNKKDFKNEFYRQNVKKILDDTLGNNNVTEKNVADILEILDKYENIPSNAKLKKFFGKSKYRTEQMGKIQEYIDNIRYNSSDKLEKLQTVSVNGEDFSVKNAFDAMVKYSDDVIKYNKHHDEMDAAMAENLKESSIAKRFITNIALVVSTLGMLTVLPKIYAKNKVPPGARTAELLKQQKNETVNKEQTSGENCKEQEPGSNNPTFKGSTGSGKPILSKFGALISKVFGEKFASEFEYNGYNFTPTLMACLSVFGLIGPRGYHAYKRAPKDDNGKKRFN